MTSRPRSKRTTSDSSSASSSSSKSGAKKPSSRRRSAGGAAEKRPPRVSLPPTMGASKPRVRRPSGPDVASTSKARTAASSTSSAKAPTKKPAPKAPAKKPAPAKPAAKAPARSAPTPPPAPAPSAPAPRPAPHAHTQPQRAPQSPQAPRPQAPQGAQPPRAPQPQPQGFQQQRPPQQPHHQQQRSPQQQDRNNQNRPPQQHQNQQQRPSAPHTPGQHNHQRPQHQGQHQQHQQRPQQQQQHQQQRPPQQHGRADQGRPPQHQNQQQRPHAPQQQHAPRPDHRPDQRNQQRDQRPPVPHSPAPHSPAAPPPAPRQQLGNAAPEGFNQKAFEEIFEKDIPFSQLGLNEWLLKGITEAGFVYPTSIQAKLIPTILTGRDVLGQAKTGTGKTAAFALPMLNAIGKGESFGGLVLVPTRELALQVAADFRELGKYTGLNVLPVYGGQNIATQAKHLSHGPEIIVATPGRVMDMAQRGYLHHHNVKMVVLDEVDRMLDIGFRDDIKRILSACPKERQTVFVSATMQPEIEQLARTFARDCEKIIASAGALTVAMVRQFYLPVEPWDKKQLLLHLLTHESPALTVVFCRTKRTVDNLAEYLGRKGIDAHAIHGDMQQGRRNRVIEQLRSGKLAVLIASDLASRGLDVEGITHVINYDLPEDPDLYVHRIGRTARAGRDGVAWALVTPEQGDLLTQIEHLINAEIPKLDYPDFKPGPLPADVLAEREAAARRAEQAKSFNRFAQSFHAPGANLPPPADSASPAPSGTPTPVVRPAYAAPAAALDAAKFPGGIVPSKMPPRLMYGKVKSARSMRQAPPPPAAPNGPGANAET